MTREETLKIMAVLKAAYPAYYKGMKSADADGIVNLWREMFADDDYFIVAAAVKVYIASDVKGFPPHIGAIKDAVFKLSEPDTMTEMEAWGLVSKALCNSAYGSAEEFAKLPPVIKKIVGSSNRLKEWALMDISKVQSVVQSNFMRSYRVKVKTEQEYATIPSDVRVFIEKTSQKFRLPSSVDK